jgi:hypothetical protein
LFSAALVQIASLTNDDKKARRDAYDTYQKLFDYCILIAGRSFDTGLWRKRESASSLADIPSPSVSPDAEKNLQVPATSDRVRSNTAGSGGNELEATGSSSPRRRSTATTDRVNEALIKQATLYFSKVFPQLRTILPEQDRVISIATNLVYYVVLPNLKSRNVYV